MKNAFESYVESKLTALEFKKESISGFLESYNNLKTSPSDVVNFIYNSKFDIEFLTMQHYAIVDNKTKLISINSSLNHSEQIYMIFHEAMHVLKNSFLVSIGNTENTFENFSNEIELEDFLSINLIKNFEAEGWDIFSGFKSKINEQVILEKYTEFEKEVMGA